jgi:hypothetical protein
VTAAGRSGNSQGLRRLALALLAALAIPATASAARNCPAARLSAAYDAHVRRALDARVDLWGNELLASRGGPTYGAAARYLRPLLWARAAKGRRLTASGVYYLPFTVPGGPQGASAAALHVADGSQIVSGRRVLTVTVDGERYGSCLARLTPARLADGWLPILETAYRGPTGARYEQESFVARAPALASFVRLTVKAGAAPARVGLGGRAAVVPARTTATLYAAQPVGAGAAPAVDGTSYEAARESVVGYWDARLAEGARIEVPEPRVENALRALLVQNLSLSWRYSSGNPYEEFSWPESIDVARVMGELGFGALERSILHVSLTRRPEPYANWKRGEKLLGTASYFRLFRDRAYVDAVTPELRGYVDALGRQIAVSGGLLARERYSSDIPLSVYGLHSQAVAWQGLREMGAVWAQTGRPALAARCRALAARLERALRGAVRASATPLPDDSLFVPAMLLDRERPYAATTEARLGSYWNLVAPYAFASGLFAPRSREAHGVLRYLQLHGSLVLGLVRAGAYALGGAGGTDEVYGNNVSRFLADNDEPDRLVLALYGQLAAAMTPNTFVQGEGATLTGQPYRSMYLPPNAAGNASFLETLRLLLVHETPTGVELAFATPRAWLATGKRVAVTNAPTSFGSVSLDLVAQSHLVTGTVVAPARGRTRLRLRLPAGERIASVRVNGAPVRHHGETIDLGGRRGSIELAVGVAGRAS